MQRAELTLVRWALLYKQLVSYFHWFNNNKSKKKLTDLWLWFCVSQSKNPPETFLTDDNKKDVIWNYERNAESQTTPLQAKCRNIHELIIESLLVIYDKGIPVQAFGTELKNVFWIFISRPLLACLISHTNLSIYNQTDRDLISNTIVKVNKHGKWCHHFSISKLKIC